MKKRLAQPEAKFLRTEKVPKKISNVLEELLTLMQTGNLQKSTVRMDRIFQEKVLTAFTPYSIINLVDDVGY